MRHHDRNRKFGRETNQRRALLRSLSEALILKEKITTTLAKAKEIRPLTEKMITRAKVASPANRRLLTARLQNDKVVTKLLGDIGPRYKDRSGGYIRITKLGRRLGDAAERARIELV